MKKVYFECQECGYEWTEDFTEENYPGDDYVNEYGAGDTKCPECGSHDIKVLSVEDVIEEANFGFKNGDRSYGGLPADPDMPGDYAPSGKKPTAKAGETYTIVGRQDDPYRAAQGATRNRYAGVNDHGGACVLTMGESRAFRCRTYFPTYDMARDFFEKFIEKFGHRTNVKFAIKKVSGNNPISGIELVRDDSDCGPYYHASQPSIYSDSKVGKHGVRPDSNGNVSYERDKQ